MADKSDKKTITILLIVLAIVAIGGGIWTYDSLKPLEDDTDILNDDFSGLHIQEVYDIKKEAVKNVDDFLEVKSSPDTIWNNFYNNEQFNRLKDTKVEINIDDYLNNPNPFIIPSSEDDKN